MTENIIMNEINSFLRSRSSRTSASYGWMLERLIDWTDHHQIDPVALNPGLVLRFLDDQAGWGNNTRRLAICAIRAFYRWWQGDLHPVLTCKLHRVHTDPQRVLSPKQTVLLLASVNPDTLAGARDLAILTMMIDTGLREFEICGIEMQRLNLDERTLAVLVKGGCWGRAVFSTVTAGHLAHWLQKRSQIPAVGSAVFCNIFTGDPMTPSTIRELFDRLSKRCGFRVSAHDLRRTFATLATKAGAPVRVTMAAGRWHSLDVFSRYVAGITADDMAPWFPVENLAEGKLH
jgi:site-specific recombinase XerD